MSHRGNGKRPRAAAGASRRARIAAHRAIVYRFAASPAFANAACLMEHGLELVSAGTGPVCGTVPDVPGSERLEACVAHRRRRSRATTNNLQITG